MSDPQYEDERVGEWWMDLEPYPGPHMSLSFSQLFSLIKANAQKIEKPLADFRKAFDEIPPATGPKLGGLEIRPRTLPRPISKSGTDGPSLGGRKFRSFH